ncbi:hypothetical protein ACOI9Y_33910, partial [Mesorhizobium japonicum]
VAPSTRLPSVRQIARSNLLSQSCVAEACERLVAQGVLAPRQGAGFMVAAQGRGVIGIDCGQAHSGLKLGGGGLPQSWRESDDLSYAIRQVARTDMASLFNYS